MSGSSPRAGWANWAGNQVAPNVTIEQPRCIEEAAAIVRTAAESGRRVKPVGAGHSFSGVARPEDIAIDLSALSDLHFCDRRRGLVTVGAGMTLRRLNRALAGVGLALDNLGDIEAQTIAGAISTGTHGTGWAHGGLATQVTGLEMILADGSVIACSAEQRPELWSAGRVGLGALGLITRVTLRCVPLFAMRADEGPMGLDELLVRFDELVEGFDHFEAYWFPHTRATVVKGNTRLRLSGGLDRLPRWKEYLEDEVLTNGAFGLTVAFGNRYPSLVPAFNRVAARALGRRSFTDLSYKVFTSPRRVRFREMECALPRHLALDAVREVVAAIDRSGLRIGFPVEIRVAPADDIPLSTASGRDTAYLAFHVPASVDHAPYFGLMARVLDPFGYRPHWGKLHLLTAGELRSRYTHFDDFVGVRDLVDRNGVFSNAYLDSVLGPAPGRGGPAPGRGGPALGRGGPALGRS